MLRLTPSAMACKNSVLASYLSTVIGGLPSPTASRHGSHCRRNSASNCRTAQMADTSASTSTGVPPSRLGAVPVRACSPRTDAPGAPGCGWTDCSLCDAAGTVDSFTDKGLNASTERMTVATPRPANIASASRKLADSTAIQIIPTTTSDVMIVSPNALIATKIPLGHVPFLYAKWANSKVNWLQNASRIRIGIPGQGARTQTKTPERGSMEERGLRPLALGVRPAQPIRTGLPTAVDENALI